MVSSGQNSHSTYRRTADVMLSAEDLHKIGPASIPYVGEGHMRGPTPLSWIMGCYLMVAWRGIAFFFSGEATDKIACVPVNNAPPMFMQVIKIKL